MKTCIETWKLSRIRYERTEQNLKCDLILQATCSLLFLQVFVEVSGTDALIVNRSRGGSTRNSYGGSTRSCFVSVQIDCTQKCHSRTLQFSCPYFRQRDKNES
jgi:hypothetical protein